MCVSGGRNLFYLRISFKVISLEILETSSTAEEVEKEKKLLYIQVVLSSIMEDAEETGFSSLVEPKKTSSHLSTQELTRDNSTGRPSTPERYVYSRTRSRALCND